jgi:GAF domain-containing protein
MAENRFIGVADLSRERRWDAYRPRALAHGVASSLSYPLSVGDRAVGALNLYGTAPGVFSSQDRQHADAFAAQVASALALTLRQAQLSPLTGQLQLATSARATIDNAIGVLMGQQQCTASAAFELLRLASAHRNRKLHAVAADVVTSVTGEPPPLP